MTGSPKARIRKIGVRVAVGLALAALAYGGLRLLTPHSQLARALLWLDSDVEDIRRFPARVVEDGPGTFVFAERDPTVAPAAIDTVRLYGDDGDTLAVPLRRFLRDRQTRAFLVVRGDTILYEAYFDGFPDTALHTSFSVAKSFTSALVGAALDRQLIESVHDPVTKYLPELIETDSLYRKITLHHLLTMSSGIGFSDEMLPWSDLASTYYAPDLRETALRKDVEGRPGHRFRYNNYNPLLVGMVLERMSDTTVSAFLSKTLWRRIGMEADGSWSLDSRDGFEKMESGLNARARDFARFGRLYLHAGVWNGRQVLPRGWVLASTRADSVADPSLRYRYYWWIHPREDGRDRFYAEGDHGQFIYVAPDVDLVFVRLGRSYAGIDWPSLFRSLSDRLAGAGASAHEER